MMIQFLVVTIVGGMIRVAMMRLMQINRLHRHDREVAEVYGWNCSVQEQTRRNTV